jgi:UDP:flavonoid glycosyltransferase YjiC (YdhE family)
MEMPELDNVRTVGPVAQPGENKRAGLPAATHLVLVAMGGVGATLPAAWPALPGITWIVAENSGLERDDVLAIERTGLSVSDLIASVDCVITKAGYGTFVEAAANGTPLLYIARPDWPEEAALATWLGSVGKCARISRARFERGDFGDLLLRMMAGPRPRPVQLTGIAEAATFIAARLNAQAH